MTYDSSNRNEIEKLPTDELIKRARNAMAQGCIHPCHVYDLIDDALQRLENVTNWRIKIVNWAHADCLEYGCTMSKEHKELCKEIVKEPVEEAK